MPTETRRRRTYHKGRIQLGSEFTKNVLPETREIPSGAKMRRTYHTCRPTYQERWPCCRKRQHRQLLAVIYCPSLSTTQWPRTATGPVIVSGGASCCPTRRGSVGRSPAASPRHCPAGGASKGFRPSSRPSAASSRAGTVGVAPAGFLR